MPTINDRHSEDCLECAYNRRCSEQERTLALSYLQGKQELQEFLKTHPEAGRIRRFLFQVLGM